MICPEICLELKKKKLFLNFLLEILRGGSVYKQIEDATGSDRQERREFCDTQFMAGVLPCVEKGVAENMRALESELGSEPAYFISQLRVVAYLSHPFCIIRLLRKVTPCVQNQCRTRHRVNVQ